MRASPVSRLAAGVFACLLAVGLTGIASGDPFSDGAVSARSLSGQFVVQGTRSASLPYALLPLATNRNYVCLEPTLVTVSSERLKQLLGRELGLAGQWKGKVYIALRPATGAGDEVVLTSMRFGDGWHYRLEMPDLIQRRQFVSGLAQALLLEFANRQAGDRSAEIPQWLVEGLTHQLLNSGEMEIILPPPRGSQNNSPPAEFVNVKRISPMASVHQALTKDAPLTFEELSWPGRSPMGAEAAELYQNSANLFLVSLTQLREGRTCLRTMLERLPRFYNWQLAFLDAFRGYFSRPLDVEKWWALQTLQFTTRDLGQVWSLAESRERLKEAVKVPVRVYQKTGDLPTHAVVTLQHAATTWPLAEQLATFDAKIRELEMLESRLAPECLPVVNEYRQVLLTYLQDQRNFETLRWAPPSASNLKRMAQELAGRLEVLDRKVSALNGA